MNIKLNQGQLNALLGQLSPNKAAEKDPLQKTMAMLAKKSEKLKEQIQGKKSDTADKPEKNSPADSLEISEEAKNLAMAQSNTNSVKTSTSAEYTNDGYLENKDNKIQNIQAGGLNISFQFDMFYELSSKVEAQMGKSGADRFVSLGAQVAETFESNFKISIDAVGSFMNGTEQSLAISNETTEAFFDAVAGMADLSPKALEDFLKESDNFFEELKANFGEAEGAFDEIKESMQSQAKDFFEKATDMRKEALSGPQKPSTPAIEAEQPKIDVEDLKDKLDLHKPTKADTASQLLQSLLPQEDEEKDSDLITMFFNKDLKVTPEDYTKFLDSFKTFAEKMRSQMFSGLFNRGAAEDSKPVSGLNLKA